MARRCCIDRTSSAAGALQIGSSTLGVGVAQLSVVQIGTDRFQIAAAGEEPAGREFVPGALVRCTPDHQFAFATWSEDEKPSTVPTVDELVNRLGKAGIVHGVDRSAVEEFARTALPGSSPVCVAVGTAPLTGKDSYTIHHVALGKSAGQLGEHFAAQMDYRERDLVKNVMAGDVLATWHPHISGRPGKGVDGKEIVVPSVANKKANVRSLVSREKRDDGTVDLVADIDGAVILHDDGALEVNELLVISGDVDLETGNIQVSGCLHITGTVHSEFKVVAGRDATVDACVEDSTLQIGGCVLVQGGVLGGDKGEVSAKGRVTVKFAQNARIFSGDNVTILSHAASSEIHCAGRLFATEGPGRVYGGHLTALGGARIKTLGSSSGTKTVVLVDNSPELHKKLKRVDRALARLRVRHTHKDHEDHEMSHRTRPKHPTVDVIDTVYPGVEIVIRGMKFFVEDRMEHIRFCVHPGTRQIEAIPLLE